MMEKINKQLDDTIQDILYRKPYKELLQLKHINKFKNIVHSISININSRDAYFKEVHDKIITYEFLNLFKDTSVADIQDSLIKSFVDFGVFGDCVEYTSRTLHFHLSSLSNEIFREESDITKIVEKYNNDVISINSNFNEKLMRTVESLIEKLKP